MKGITLEAEIDICRDDHLRSTDTRREERRRAILDAAEAMFLENDFPRVSLNAIVRKSGGSLATVYEMFGNKQGLLRAVVHRRKEEGMGGLLDIPDGETPAETLTRYAHQCHAFATTPRSIALLRVVIGETLCHPDFGREFFDDMNSGPAEQLAGCFREWTAQGKAKIDDPDAAAQLYFATVMCEAPLKSMLGAQPEGTNCGQMEWRLAPFFAHFGISDG